MADWISGNRYLSKSEMQNNAELIWGYFNDVGWTMESVAGMLGNMQSESSVNPGIWQDLKVNYNMGFGLVQWTPATKYINWAGSNYQHGYLQCSRILWELNNRQQWISTSAYPLSFAEFAKSTETPEYLAQAFLKNYERPENQNQPIRSTQAREWYNFLGGSGPPPDPPDPPEPPTGNWPKGKLWMYMKRR